MCSVQVILISQNLRLESLRGLDCIDTKEPIVIVSTQYLFDYERNFLESFMKSVSYYTFADLLADEDMAQIDHEAYLIENVSLGVYYNEIKALKNRRIIDRLETQFQITKRVIASDNLGIDAQTWLDAGYDRFIGEYYYKEPVSIAADVRPKNSNYLRDVYQLIKSYLKKPIYSAHYHKDKYVFYGETVKVAHRMDLDFKRDKAENFIYVANLILYKIFHTVPCRKNVIHLSTLHEHYAWQFPHTKNYQVRLLQDGYLPPNYTSLYLKFIQSNEAYFAYDHLGKQIFMNQGVPVSLLPFRKKQYMPQPNITRELKNILVVTSGAGDWTAIKNRSDEDKMAEAFVEIASRYPGINFIYRCHPLWIHPDHQGVNSISRIAEYFKKTGLTNLRISGNIPQETLEDFHLFVPPQSLAADLENADFVIGEHSVAMLDAGFQQIPFASFNVTGRRNLFCGISDMGFPHFESVDALKNFIDHFGDLKMQDSYQNAVRQYNDMIDRDL